MTVTFNLIQQFSAKPLPTETEEMVDAEMGEACPFADLLSALNLDVNEETANPMAVLAVAADVLPLAEQVAVEGDSVAVNAPNEWQGEAELVQTLAAQQLEQVGFTDIDPSLGGEAAAAIAGNNELAGKELPEESNTLVDDALVVSEGQQPVIAQVALTENATDNEPTSDDVLHPTIAMNLMQQTLNQPSQQHARPAAVAQSHAAAIATGTVQAANPRQSQWQIQQYQGLAIPVDEIEPELPGQNFNQLLQQVTLPTATAAPTAVSAVALNHNSQITLPAGSQTFAINQSLTSPQWSQNFAERLFWSAQNNISRAEIHLNPAELGPLSARIRVEDEKASLMFISQHVQVREAVESAMPKLRVLFEGSELELLDVSITDEQSQSLQQRYQQFNQPEHSLPDGEIDTVHIAHVPVNQHQGLVDYYA